jgi:hypothetical protein
MCLTGADYEVAMKITLQRAAVLTAAKAYEQSDYAGPAEDWLIARLPLAACRGHMTKAELRRVARWKWRGGAVVRLVNLNTAAEVREITAASFGAKSEKLRVGALLSITGVGWPMASVILHFAFRRRYPILDRRAMKAVGGSTHYTFDLWEEYSDLCRRAAKRLGVSMRTLDRALWIYGGD